MIYNIEDGESGRRRPREKNGEQANRNKVILTPSKLPSFLQEKLHSLRLKDEVFRYL